MSSMARVVSLSVLTTLIVFLGITFYRVIAPFLLPLFLAGVVAILCQPLFRYFRRKTNDRVRLAAGLTTGTVMAAVLVPLLVGTFVASLQLFLLAQSSFVEGSWEDTAAKLRTELDIDNIVARLEPIVGHDIDADELQEQIQANLKVLLTDLGKKSLGLAATTIGLFGSLISGVISAVMFVIGLYYFLADGPALLQASHGLIPVQVQYQKQLVSNFNAVVRAVVTATFLAAIVQGLVTALMLAVAGYPHFFITFIIATLAALIPLAGTWLVWGPCAIWSAWQGNWGTATFLLLFGSIVVGMLDNVIRTYVLNSDAKLHPLLAFVSVLGGLQSMGLWGVFIGPIVASCLHALVQIFNTELQELSHEKFGTKDDRPPEEETPENPESETVAEPDEAAGKESAGEDGNAPESKDNKASDTASRSAGKEPATNAEDKK
jgi:predicted PurR-regulated permease PerM